MFEAFDVIRDADMRQYTTLRLGGKADWLAFPRSREEIAALYAEAGREGLPVTVIGHGSNLLVLDGGIRGLVIRIEKNMRAIRRDGNRLIAQAGAMLGSVAMAAAEAGLTGLEFASGIPGTIGGGMTMNAGAYGGVCRRGTDRVYQLHQLLPSRILQGGAAPVPVLCGHGEVRRSHSAPRCTHRAPMFFSCPL